MGLLKEPIATAQYPYTVSDFIVPGTSISTEQRQHAEFLAAQANANHTAKKNGTLHASVPDATRDRQQAESKLAAANEREEKVKAHQARITEANGQLAFLRQQLKIEDQRFTKYAEELSQIEEMIGAIPTSRWTVGAAARFNAQTRDAARHYELSLVLRFKENRRKRFLTEISQAEVAVKELLRAKV